MFSLNQRNLHKNQIFCFSWKYSQSGNTQLTFPPPKSGTSDSGSGLGLSLWSPSGVPTCLLYVFASLINVEKHVSFLLLILIRRLIRKGTSPRASLEAQTVKNLPCNAGDLGSIPGSGRSPGGGHGNPLRYSYLGNPMVRGAWQATVHGVEKRVRHDWAIKMFTFFHFQRLTGNKNLC